jgi:hypothetical protein
MDRDARGTVALAPMAESVGRANSWLRVLGLAALGTAASIIGISLSDEPSIWIAPLVLLSVILVGAEHRDRLFGDGTSVSGSIVVSMASIAVFARGQWLAAPMICSAVAGLYWPHIRTRALSRIAINAGSMSLAAGTAAFVFRVVAPPSNAIGVQLSIAGVLALSTFWIINSAILAAAVAALQGRRWLRVVLDLVRSDTALLPFALIGLGCGYLVGRAGEWIGWLALLVTLALADALLIRKGVARVKRQTTAAATLVVALAVFGATALMVSNVGYSLIAVVVLAMLGVLLPDRRFRFAQLFVVTCLVTAAVVFHSDAPLFAPLAVALAVCIAASIRTRTDSILPLASATALAAVAVGSASVLLPIDLEATIWGALVMGLVCGVAALIGWHVALGLDLATRLGAGAWRSVVDLARTDLHAFVLAGFVGSICGWFGRVDGVRGLAVSLSAACVLGIVAARVSRRAVTKLGDDALLDVVQSALLDLPASPLPDDL